jgi:hypothetical protein
MADSILSSLLSKSSSLVISKSADRSNKNVIEKFKVSQVGIQFRSRPMRHMREDGISIVDARVLDPITLDISIFCSTLDEIKAVNNLFEDRVSTYTISSRGLVFKNMTMVNFDVKQTPEMLTASPVQFSMKQLKKQGGDEDVHIVVEQPPDSSLISFGIQKVTDATQSVNDLFLKVIRG